MGKILLFILLSPLSVRLLAQQRIIAECTINYTIAAIDSADNSTMKTALNSSTKTVYIKGNQCRTDLKSSAYSQSIIYDKTSGNATILREFGNSKFMTRLDSDKWVKENKQFDGLTIENTQEHQSILGYDCTKILLHLKDGTTASLFFTKSIIPSVKEFEYQFKDINGLVLSYEAIGAKGEKVKYTASKVNLSPVPSNIFAIPTSGYRIL